MLLDEALPHLPRLRRYAHLLTGDAASADDLLQDTLERAARKWQLWRPEQGPAERSAALRAWLLTLMHHLFVNQWRSRQRHLHESYEDEGPWAAAPEPQLQTALRLDLERSLSALPPAAREVLLLVCVEELSYEQAASVLAVPVGTVMSRLSRARERLRCLMEGGTPTAAAPSLRRIK